MNNESAVKRDTTPARQETGEVAANAAQQQKRQRNEATLLPAVDVFEDKDGITLYADMPGVSKDQLDLHVEADTLTIEGEVALDVPSGMEASYVDVATSKYRRVFTLSKELDAEQVSAELKNGVLTLRIPKAAHAQPRKIQVTAS